MKLTPISLQAVIEHYKRAGKKTLAEVSEAIRRRMSEEGKPSTSPVKWDSPKQRRAYFATDGFGHGIPYVRKGNYGRGWTVTEIRSGYKIANGHPAGAIGGRPATGWQSRIHRGRWNYLPKIFAQEIHKLPRILLENLRVSFRA